VTFPSSNNGLGMKSPFGSRLNEAVTISPEFGLDDIFSFDGDTRVEESLVIGVNAFVVVDMIAMMAAAFFRRTILVNRLSLFMG
jgi:hypothetical protein